MASSNSQGGIPADSLEDDRLSAALGHSAVNFFRFFLVAILNEGLLPGYRLQRVTNDDDATGNDVLDAVMGMTDQSQQVQGSNPLTMLPVEVPNYCRPEIKDGPWYTVLKGIRVGIYNHTDDVIRAIIGFPNIVRRFESEADAKQAFVSASRAFEVNIAERLSIPGRWDTSDPAMHWQNGNLSLAESSLTAQTTETTLCTRGSSVSTIEALMHNLPSDDDDDPDYIAELSSESDISSDKSEGTEGSSSTEIIDETEEDQLNTSSMEF